MLTLFRQPERYPLVHTVDESTAMPGWADLPASTRPIAGAQCAEAQTARGWRLQLDEEAIATGRVEFLFGPWFYVKNDAVSDWQPVGQNGFAVEGSYDDATGEVWVRSPSAQAAKWWDDRALSVLREIVATVRSEPRRGDPHAAVRIRLFAVGTPLAGRMSALAKVFDVRQQWFTPARRIARWITITRRACLGTDPSVDEHYALAADSGAQYLPPEDTRLQMFIGEATAVLFVADSQSERARANVESLQRLRSMIDTSGRRVSDVPVVFLLSKRDLPSALPREELIAQLPWPGATSADYFEVHPPSGRGVPEAIRHVLQRVANTKRSSSP